MREKMLLEHSIFEHDRNCGRNPRYLHLLCCSNRTQLVQKTTAILTNDILHVSSGMVDLVTPRLVKRTNPDQLA